MILNMTEFFLQATQSANIQKLDFDNLVTLVGNWLVLNGPRILIAFAVLLIGRWIIRIFKNWLAKFFFKREMHESVKPFIESLITVSIQALLLIAIMQILGVRLTIFAAVVASFGVTLGVALSGTLQNFACGLLILFLKPFKVNDHIIAQGHDGIVESIQIFYTIVKTENNRTVIIPNSKLSNEVIVKYP
jgi:small conductance mechanosensitive channel